MKHLTKLLLLALMAVVVCGFSARAAKGKGPGYITKTIPGDFNIKDKIIVENESSYRLQEVHVYLINSKGKYVKLGSARNVKTDEKVVIKSYDDNKLQSLRGRKIAISIIGAGQRPTSNFKVKLDDHRHDLYIEIENK